MQNTELAEASRLLQQHGVLEKKDLEPLVTGDYQHLLAALNRQVCYLLERDMERLMQALYRIDIPDHKFREALLADKPSQQIAIMILERELLKVKTRRWYASRTAAADASPEASTATPQERVSTADHTPLVVVPQA